MTEKEIIEGNKLIAEYYAEKRPQLSKTLYYRHGVEFSGFGIEDSKYHKSWNWLMPVVVKIESDLNIRVEIIGYLCNIYKTTRDPSVKEKGGFKDILLVSEKHNDKIMAIWMAVVRYIKKDFIDE